MCNFRKHFNLEVIVMHHPYIIGNYVIGRIVTIKIKQIIYLCNFFFTVRS